MVLFLRETTGMGKVETEKNMTKSQKSKRLQLLHMLLWEGWWHPIWSQNFTIKVFHYVFLYTEAKIITCNQIMLQKESIHSYMM